MPKTELNPLPILQPEDAEVEGLLSAEDSVDFVVSARKVTTPGLKLTTLDRFGTERLAYEEFASKHTATAYRDILAHLYAQWHEWNTKYFEGRLLVPHIGIGPTPSRRFSQCRLTTNYGGAMEIILGEKIAFGEATRIVREPWPAAGLVRFLEDLLLGEMVKQFVLEVRGSDEHGYGGYGPLFATEATRIGPAIGLPEGEVRARRRAIRGRGEPVAAFWPWAFRDEGYYLGHVRLSHVMVGGARTTARPTDSVVPGVFDYLLHLASTNQNVRLIDVLGRQVDAELESRSPAVAAFERSPTDQSGMRLPTPVIENEWLTWNSGCVRAIAEGILTRRQFGVMPILADALQDAGCEDTVLLDHCRANSSHTANCWALALLTARP